MLYDFFFLLAIFFSEEIAKKLQEEENRLAAEAAAEANTPRQTDVPPPDASPHPTQHSPHSHDERKKKDVSITGKSSVLFQFSTLWSVII